MSESRNQISELVAAVEAVGEFGKIARRIFLTPGVVGAVQGPLDVAEHRVHPPQARRSQLPGPPPVTRGRCSQPASSTPRKQASPSDRPPSPAADAGGRPQRNPFTRSSATPPAGLLRDLHAATSWSAFASSGFAPQVGIVHPAGRSRPVPSSPASACFSEG